MKRILTVSAAAVALVLACAGVAYAQVEAPYSDSTCLLCHGVGTSSIAQSKVDFSAAPGGVDYAKCRACHFGTSTGKATPYEPVLPDWASEFPDGTPHLHSGAIPECGDCHAEYQQWGFPFFKFVPRAWTEAGATLATTPYGFFLTEGSIVNPDLAALHSAHDGNGRISQLLGGYSNWDSKCASCHGAASCNACHTDPVHGDHGDTPSCTDAGCHPAAAPSEIPSCTGCHPDASGKYHGAEHASDTEGCSGSYCHQTPDLMSVHTQRNAAFECATCHNVDYSAQIAQGVTDCLACHEAAHENIAEAHTASDSQECVDCHKSADLFVLHEDADAGPCAVCHSVAFLPESADCVNCHAYSPVAENHYPASAHLAAPNSGCGNCHSLDLNTEHAKYSVGCVACHGGAFDSVVADWDKTCDGCHPTRHKDRDSGGGSGGGGGGKQAGKK